MVDLGSVLELSTTDVVLIVLLGIFVYRWFIRKEPELPEPPKIPARLPMQDLTLGQLRKYNGKDDEHILFAVNGTIFDVSRGTSFYGPGGPYGALAGRDATRALGKMDVSAVKDEWDDVSDLTADERQSATEWFEQFKFKYPKVGLLVKNAEDAQDYNGKISEVDI